MFSLAHLRTLRLAEVDDVVRYLRGGERILEIGAGTGEQAAELARRGFDVTAIDVAASVYSPDRVYDVKDYDGVHLPFPDCHFDIVFSSNVLEHVVPLDELESEIKRVLARKGRCIHLVPTPLWRLWSAVSVFASAMQAGGQFLATAAGRRAPGVSYWHSVQNTARRFAGQSFEAIRQSRHGERGNRFTELYYFSLRWWCRHFREAGFTVVEARPAGLFYTGYMALGSSLSVEKRRRMSRFVGSACHLFVLQPFEECERRPASVESR